MVYELNQEDFRRVAPMFKNLKYQPMCQSVVHGIYPGRIFVDDIANPSTALLLTFLGTEKDSIWGFMVGSPLNEDFNTSVNNGFFKREIIHPDVPTLLITCESEEWNEAVSTIYHPRKPVQMPRRHYIGTRLAFDWRMYLPEGYSVHQQNEDLLQSPGIEIPDEISQNIKKWRTYGAEMQDYGFAIVHEDPTASAKEIAAWSTVDFVVDGMGDIGFYTRDHYRKKGLATVVAAAAVAHGFSIGLSLIAWTCTEQNLGSIRIAEKLGFERVRDYSIQFMVFEESNHLANLAFHYMNNSQYEAALEVFDTYLTLTADPPGFVYMDIARGWAGLGVRDKTIRFLKKASDNGFDDYNELVSYPEFTQLLSAEELKLFFETKKSEDTQTNENN